MAQTKDILSFRRGDVVPNLTLTLRQGKTEKSLRLYDLKTKLVLFDLWGVTCSSCIRSFPHMLELQKQFGDDIQIILVTLNSREEVEKLWSKLRGHVPDKIIEAYRQLPSVVGDSTLFSSFPKNGVPAHVWIDHDHVVRSIAYGYSTTAAMIQNFIEGKRVHFNEQMPQKIDFNNPLSWLNGVEGFLSSLQYYSFILSRIEHAGGNDGQMTTKVDSSTGKLLGLSTVNMKISDLYKMAYFPNQNPMSVFDSRLLLEIKDKGRFYPPGSIENHFDWADTSQFCLAIRMPSDKSELLYSSLRNLLDSYFHYRSKMETRSVKCMVLKRIVAEDKIKTKGGLPVYDQSTTEKGTCFIYKNRPLGDLVSNLQTLIYVRDPYIPFFDETGYEGNIDITVPWSDDPKKISFEKVRKTLNTYGLDIVEEYRNLEMLVISDAL